MTKRFILTLRAWCLLLLAAVAAQALVPMAEARPSGSPLNPSTIEVSIGHPGRDSPSRLSVERRDDDDIPARASFLVDAPRTHASPRMASTAVGTNPRAGGMASAGPRAPPAA